MARKKKTENTVEGIGDMKFFVSSVEGLENVNVTGANEISNPLPNSTGSFSLDNDLVIPIPEGGYIEIYGPESSCKSTLLLEIMGQALLKGKACLYLNLEKTIQRSLLNSIRPIKQYLDSLKPGEESLFQILDSVAGEKALEAGRQFAMRFPGGIVGVDSIDALLPEEAITRDIGDQKVASLPQLMSDAMRKLLDAAFSNNVSFVFTNQFRTKIEKFQMGDPRITSGGNALKYYASQRIQLKPPGKDQAILNEDGDQIGHVVRYTIIKNKCAPSTGMEGEFPILYYHGIFREQEIITLCLKFGILGMGGKGGKQVILPKLDGTDETITMSRFKASRRLLMDRKLYDHLHAQLKDIVVNTSIAQSVQDFLQDEVQED